MIRFPWRFVLVSLGTAWVFDLLFWQKPMGISLLIWVSLLIIGSIILARTESKKISGFSYILIAAILVLAIMVFIRQEPFTQAFNFLLSLLLLFILSATFGSGFWVQFRVVDYIVSGFFGVVAAFSRPFDLSQKSEQEVDGNFEWKSLPRKMLPVLRGLIIALPVVIVLGVLLASADPIFSDWMEDWLKIFDLERLTEYLFRFFYIVILAYLFSGLYLFAIHPKREQKKPDPSKPWLKSFLGWTETAVVLVCVNLLFAVFLIVQFRYFFGGGVNISAAGYTFAEYARRGFGELLAVAVLSLLLYLGLGTITRQTSNTAKRGFSILSMLILGQVIVMLVSAFQRLLLYESAYGFTRLRTYSHVFMIWLGVLLGVVAVLELIRQRGRFALVLLSAVFGFSLTLAFLNVDALVVRQNVQRAQEGIELDADYLQELSTDAVPVMVELFLDEGQPSSERDALGAELACRSKLLKEDEPLPWPSYSLSRSRAARLLTKYEASWEAFPVSMKQGEWVVEVGGEEKNCRLYEWYD